MAVWRYSHDKRGKDGANFLNALLAGHLGWIAGCHRHGKSLLFALPLRYAVRSKNDDDGLKNFEINLPRNHF